MDHKIAKICSISRCCKAVRARGYCVGHYSNWLRHGTPEYTGLKSGACSDYVNNVVLLHEGDECLRSRGELERFRHELEAA